jgi:GNAT superfamily N-acetyltransferase
MGKKNDAYRVRRAELADLGELTQLFAAYRVFYGEAWEEAQAEVFLRERLTRGESVLFLAERLESGGGAGVRAGAGAGFVQLYPSFSSVGLRRIWILNDLFVQEAHRRQGLGRMLLNAAKAHASVTQAVRLELSTGKRNTGAQQLYESLGYVREEDFYNYSLML